MRIKKVCKLCIDIGYGRKLYEALEIALRQQNIINVYALIAYTDTEDEHLTHNSVEYHSHLGYREVGKLCRCGYKFGKWYDLVWMEKLIGEYEEAPKPFVPFSEINKSYENKK